jgi:hypothetical protein
LNSSFFFKDLKLVVSKRDHFAHFRLRQTIYFKTNSSFSISINDRGKIASTVHLLDLPNGMEYWSRISLPAASSKFERVFGVRKGASLSSAWSNYSFRARLGFAPPYPLEQTSFMQSLGFSALIKLESPSSKSVQMDSSFQPESRFSVVYTPATNRNYSAGLEAALALPRFEFTNFKAIFQHRYSLGHISAFG